MWIIACRQLQIVGAILRFRIVRIRRNMIRCWILTWTLIIYLLILTISVVCTRRLWLVMILMIGILSAVTRREFKHRINMYHLWGKGLQIKWRRLYQRRKFVQWAVWHQNRVNHLCGRRKTQSWIKIKPKKHCQ